MTSHLYANFTRKEISPAKVRGGGGGSSKLIFFRLNSDSQEPFPSRVWKLIFHKATADLFVGNFYKSFKTIGLIMP